MRQAIQAWSEWIARVRAWFPDRQIYFRSNGVVRYLVIPSRIQMAASVAGVIVVGWVGLTTIHYLSRDIVLEAREARIADLEAEQSSLAGDIDFLKREAIERAERLEARQRYLGELLDENDGAGDDRDVIGPPDSAAPAGPAPVSKETMLDTDGRAMYASFAPSFTVRPDLGPERIDRDARDFALAIGARLDTTQARQDLMADKLAARFRDRIEVIDRKLEGTGLSSDTLVSRWSGDVASGGPYAPASVAPLFAATARDAASAALFESLESEVTKTQKLLDALSLMPAGAPADDYFVSSRFGRRIDPFTRARAMHYGLDMAGWPGTKVRNASRGKVVRAGVWGPYGNMIEIDHGNGFRTRYGHLRKIHVKRGEVLEAGQPIGEMGCSGRCTSTHLHYEVWFDGKPLNPLAFLEVPKDVYKIERGLGH